MVRFWTLGQKRIRNHPYGSIQTHIAEGVALPCYLHPFAWLCRVGQRIGARSR